MQKDCLENCKSIGNPFYNTKFSDTLLCEYMSYCPLWTALWLKLTCKVFKAGLVISRNCNYLTSSRDGAQSTANVQQSAVVLHSILNVQMLSATRDENFTI